MAVDAAAIDPFDLTLVTGHRRPVELRYTPGRDLAGEVVAGPEAMIGRRVWATGGELGTTRDGFHADYAVIPAGAALERPASLTAVQAATVGVPFTTAWYGLIELGQLRPEDRVLILGGGGSVGGAALQLAAWLGASSVTTVVSGPSQVHRAHASGATTVLTSGEELTPDLGPTLCLDAVGGPLLAGAVAAMADGGRIVTLASIGDGTTSFDLRSFYRKSLTLRGLFSGKYRLDDGGRVLEQLAPGFAGGVLRPPPVAATFDLRDAAAAFALAASGPAGKVVLEPVRASNALVAEVPSGRAVETQSLRATRKRTLSPAGSPAGAPATQPTSKGARP